MTRRLAALRLTSSALCILTLLFGFLKLFEVNLQTISLPIAGRADRANKTEQLVERYCPLASEVQLQITDPLSRQYTDGPWGEALLLLDPAGPITSLDIDWAAAQVGPFPQVDRAAIREVRLLCGWVHNVEERWEATTRQILASPSPFGDPVDLAHLLGESVVRAQDLSRDTAVIDSDGRFDLELTLQWALSDTVATDTRYAQLVPLQRQMREQLLETQNAKRARR
jgi:hypothetical protein